MKTFKEIKKFVGVTEGKLPGAKSLMDRTDVVAREVRDGAEATIFSSGHILYIKEEHATVYTVDRCREMGYEMAEKMDEETAECYRQQGYEVKNGRLYIPESFYADMPWFDVVAQICEERLDHNQESREESHTDFSLDNDGNDWDEHTWIPDFVEEAFKKQDEEEAETKRHETLMLALLSLTDRQREIVNLYFGEDGMTEKKVAVKLGISQQAVHKALAAAVTKLKKFF